MRAEPAKAKLGARLLCAAQLVAPRAAVADIGCDHGKLAVWLALKGAPKVIAVDLRPMPLAKARALALQSGCAETVDCRLGSGLAPLAPHEAGEIVIAGLSGETMVQILAACAWVQSSGVHLVLVPTMRAGVLRRWLCEAGFELDREVAVHERGRFYTVMSARYTGRALQPDALFCEVGLLAACADDAAAGYLKARLENLRKQALAPMDAPQRLAHEKLMEEVAACLR